MIVNAEEKRWWKEAVFYQIYPRSWQDSNGDGIGDIRGIINRIDYLVQLGITAVWLGPVCQSPGDDNGYDVSDYQAIQPEFGTLADWDELLEKLHAAGIRLLVDLVVNHTSDEHPWFIEARQSKNSPKRDWYIWRPGKNGAEPNNWGSFFAPSAWEYDEASGEYYLHLFSKKQPDLNWHNPAVRGQVYSMMRWWLERGADGFRMDVINLLCKTPGLPDAEGTPDADGYVFPARHIANVPPVHEYLQEMAREAYPDRDVFTVGECLYMDIEQGRRYTGGKQREMDACFSFAHIDMDGGESGKWQYRPWTLPELKKALADWQYGIGRGWLGLFWSNQDQPRALSRFGTTTGPYRMRCAKMLGTVLHTLRGTPFIYQGEELGMVNVPFERVSQLRDVESLDFVSRCRRASVPEADMWDGLRRKGRDNARVPMPWDATAHGGFTTGTPWIGAHPEYETVNVAAALADPNSVLYYYRKLIALRKKYPLLVYGGFTLLWPQDPAVFAHLREYEGERWLVAANFTAENQRREWPGELPLAREYIISNVAPSACGAGSLTLAPYEAKVLRLAEGKG